MDEDTMQAFATACRTGSVTRSAQMLHRSQPAISRRIASLEAEIGVTLLERTTSGVRPTPAGAALLVHIDTALAALHDGRAAARHLVNHVTGPVSLAIVGTLASGWLTDALRAFADHNLGVDVRLHTANSNDVVEAVRRADADIGIGYGRADEPGLACEPLAQEDLVVACAADHPLAGQTVGPLGSLRDEQWFAFGERLPRAETNARFIAGLLAAAGIPDDSIRTVDSLTAQLRLIEAGFGIALIPRSHINDARGNSPIATINTDERPTTTIYITTRATVHPTATTDSLIQSLRHFSPGGS